MLGEIIIAVILILCLLFYYKHRNDKKNNKIIEGLYTFNGRMAVDDQYFYDKLFDDVVYYPNEYDQGYELGDLIKTGWQRCNEECPGHCVEYGQTGCSYCFSF